MPRCSYCLGYPEDVGPLCLSPHPYLPREERRECKRCFLEGRALHQAGLDAEADRLDRIAHIDSCGFCMGKIDRESGTRVPTAAFITEVMQACAKRRQAERAAA